MSKFGLGDRVKNTRTGELGYVVKVLPPHRGAQMYRVKYDDRELENNERRQIKITSGTGTMAEV